MGLFDIVIDVLDAVSGSSSGSSYQNFSHLDKNYKKNLKKKYHHWAGGNGHLAEDAKRKLRDLKGK